jgi:GT2 family glycosyltransferase
MPVTLLLCVLVVCEALVLLLWCWGLLWIRGLRIDPDMQVKPEPDEPPDPAAPALAVILAAHNEEAEIETCLRSLLAQNYANMTVVVADDRSEDQTAARVRALMADDPRVRLVQIDHLPAGWIGKTHALSVAYGQAVGDYLLFMDCDCRFAPGAIVALMKKIVGEGLEFASLMPCLELQSRAERLLTPPICWLLGLWALLGLGRGRPKSELRLGNGQFMLFARDAYRRLGGHASVPAELAEDLALANKAVEIGLRRWVGLGKGMYVTTRANGFAGTLNALTRVLIGSLVQPWRILLSPHLLFGGLAAPLWIIPLGTALGLSFGNAAAWVLAAAGLLHLMLLHRVIGKLFPMLVEPRPSVWSLTAGGFLCGAMLHWAYLVSTGRARVRWGKTLYRVRGSRIVDAISAAEGSAIAP